MQLRSQSSWLSYCSGRLAFLDKNQKSGECNGVSCTYSSDGGDLRHFDDEPESRCRFMRTPAMGHSAVLLCGRVYLFLLTLNRAFRLCGIFGAAILAAVFGWVVSLSAVRLAATFCVGHLRVAVVIILL